MQASHVGRTAWEVACELLEVWRASNEPPPDRGHDEDIEQWDRIVENVGETLRRSPTRQRITQDESEAISRALQHGPVGAHAAAWALDQHRWTSFARPWVAGRVVEPTEGDLYPISDWDDVARPIQGRLSRPWRTQMRPGELPHVRRFSPGLADPPVQFDGRWFDQLGFLTEVRLVAAGVLNVSQGEFTAPAGGFPVEASAVRRQVQLACRAVTMARATGCGLLVLPELAVPRQAVRQIADALRDGRQHLAVVAGSRHEREPYRRNVASLVVPGGAIVEFEKRERFWAGDVREGIDATRQPLRILVAETARVAVPICKDFLTDDLRHTLKRCGANIVAVPSMSPTTDLHEQAAHDLAAGHGLSVIANGPLEWQDGRCPAGALLGRPDGLYPVVRAARLTAPSLVTFDVTRNDTSTDSLLATS